MGKSAVWREGMYLNFMVWVLEPLLWSVSWCSYVAFK